VRIAGASRQPAIADDQRATDGGRTLSSGSASLRDALWQSFSGWVQFDAEANRQLGASLWNADVAPDVLALLKCRSTADVQQAVRMASDHGAPISTPGGGHDWAAAPQVAEA
jgi:FAD/FMN-containing dehydrogenase